MSYATDGNKRLCVKLWDGTKQDVHVSETDTYDDFVSKVVELANPGAGKSVRFICKGKIISAKNFASVEPGSLLLCLTTLNSAEAPTPVSNTPSSSQTLSAQAQARNTQPQEPTYTYKHVKATLVVFLDMIRSNRQLKQLYENDYGQLVTEILKNPDLDTMLKNILSQSGQIMNAMEKGENISVNVSGNTGSGQPGTMDVIDLSVEDQGIVEEITSMGFDRVKVVVAYLSCNKDREDTINSLLNA